MSTRHIPFAKPDIGEAEIQEVVDSLRSGWLTSGPKMRKLEAEFAERVGARHAVAVNSGTAAMHLALEAMGVAPGDRVLTTVYTFTATAEVVRYLGADPVFVDIEPDTLNMAPDQVARALDADPDIKVLLPVHFAGQACDMESLQAAARKTGARLLEDAAHAFPATSGGRLVGSIGDATAFSFYATKTLAVGEGGMLTTDDERLAERARVMRLHGISRDVFDRYRGSKPSWEYEVIAPGFKYNLTDVAAAIGLHQLRRADEMCARRERIARRYLDAFASLPLQLPAIRQAADRHAWHLFVVQLDTARLAIDRDAFIRQLSERGVGTSVHFIPLHRQPYWRDTYGLRAEQFPRAEAAFHRVVSLPLYSAMSDDEVEYVVDAVTDILAAGYRA
jgi:dTDP-4-amino-4,6-dideoxygalactose transaminase